MLSTTSAAKVCGLPSKTLRRWIEREALRPDPLLGEKRGRLWAWSLEDIVAARTIAALYAAGAHPRAIRRAVAKINRAGESLASARLWWSGGDVVRLVSTPDEETHLVESLLRRPGQLGYLLVLGDWANEAQRAARRLGFDLALRRARG
ncbi:MAG: MerR family transcriptional regulator [bacterium]